MDRDLWEEGFLGDPFTLNSNEPMDFEFLDHDEALSVFRSPRPSDTLDELEKLAVRERIMKETGDYPLGYPFRFETHTAFTLDDLRSSPVTDMFEEEGGGFSDTSLGEDLVEHRPFFPAPLEENPWKSEVVETFHKADDEEDLEEESR